MFLWWIGCFLGWRIGVVVGLLVSRVCVFCRFAVVVAFVGFGILVVDGSWIDWLVTMQYTFAYFEGLFMGGMGFGKFGFLVWGMALCGVFGGVAAGVGC